MPKKTSYSNGTPCWIDVTAPDLGEARQFYSALFGWEFEDTGEQTGHYTLAKVKGEMVAAIAPAMADQPGPPAWTTYLWADNADETVRKIGAAGGNVMMGPMDVMEQGRMAIAADTTGAVFGIWQGNQHRGAGLVNEAGTFVWNEILSTDPARTRDFYQQVFGYTYEEPQGMTMPDYVVCKVGGDMVGGIGRQPDMIPKGTPSFWNTYFVVTDTDAAATKIGELGGQVMVPPQDAPFGRFAVARDKGGASFCVMTPPSGAGQSG